MATKNTSILQDLYVCQTDGINLKAHDHPVEGFGYQLVSTNRKITIPVNDTAAMVWEHCRKPILVSDLLHQFAESFPEARSIESDILGVLGQYRRLGLVTFAGKKITQQQYPLKYTPKQGQRSAKAERLVDFCLGEFKSKLVFACSEDPSYLNRDDILLLETSSHGAQLTAGVNRNCLDQKRVVEALISQRAVIRPGLRCWLVRGDSSGTSTIPEQGLHIAAMRPASRRHLVLVPSADRNRYLGPNLERQMNELRHSWVPWEEKSDTAWWGGALTGDRWSQNEPRTLTRREVLYYYQNNPSDRVRLHLTELPSTTTVPPGIEVKDRFSKESAFRNKCLVLLPGNDIASGTSWYFCGNSVVLMPEPHLEHILYFEIEPWVHYIPLAPDPADILVKLKWVLDNQDKARRIVDNAHERLRWFCGPEYLWACNEVLRRITEPDSQQNNENVSL